jgi:hypothetical protein
MLWRGELALMPSVGKAAELDGFLKITNVFSKGGGKSMAEREKVHFLGSLPIDTQLVELLDSAQPTTMSQSPQNGAPSPTQPPEPPLQPTDLSAVTQLNTLSGVQNGASTGVESSSGSMFEVLERYQQTPTWGLFKPMAEYIIAQLA